MILVKVLVIVEYILLGFAANVVTIGTFAGVGTSGSTGNGGAATSAKFIDVLSVSQDTAGAVYMTDGLGCTVRSVSASGIITGFAGVSGVAYPFNDGNDGPATSATLSKPIGLFVNTLSVVYITDGYGNSIRKVSTDGTITMFAGTGDSYPPDSGGKATSTVISGPWGVWGNSVGVIYVVISSRGLVKAISTNNIVTMYAGVSVDPNSFGGNGGYATSAYFRGPTFLFGSSTGVLYISDQQGNEVRAISTSGIVTNFLGLDTGVGAFADAGSAATETGISAPLGVYVNSAGDVYVADVGSYIVRKVPLSTGIVETFAGQFRAQASNPSEGDGGSPTSAKFGQPYGIFGNTLSEMFIVDNSKRQVRKVSQLSTDPTVLPTTTPSTSPSVSPTIGPSVLPSIAPSRLPSVLPSLNPTIVPTIDPTSTPTVVPSIGPSMMPSEEPSVMPSDTPTVVPTVSPTVGPTVVPSIVPSVHPSVLPSVQPSESPFVAPTEAPTVAPSSLPTVDPTLLPSVTPSTVKPTVAPSRPTIAPSRIPSKRPVRGGASSVPTASPSAAPTIGNVDISFNASIALQNISSSFLDGTSQTAVVAAVATTLNVNSSSVTFTSQQTTGQTTVRRLSDGSFSYEVLVVVNVLASSKDFTDAINHDGSYLYHKLSNRLIYAVNSNAFAATLRTESAVLHATSTLYVGKVNVTVNEYVVVMHNDDADSTSRKNDLTNGDFAGVVIGILVCFLVCVGFGIYCGKQDIHFNADSSLSSSALAPLDAVVVRKDIEGSAALTVRL